MLSDKPVHQRHPTRPTARPQALPRQAGPKTKIAADRGQTTRRWEAAPRPERLLPTSPAVQAPRVQAASTAARLIRISRIAPFQIFSDRLLADNADDLSVANTPKPAWLCSSLHRLGNGFSPRAHYQRRHAMGACGSQSAAPMATRTLAVLHGRRSRNDRGHC
jgi:hypothetical protein